MKKILFIFCAICSLIATANAQEATINSIKCSKNGSMLNIDVDLNVNNAKYKDVTVIAYFYDKNKNKLRDQNNRYKTSDNQVCLSENISPRYENSHYENLTLSMPLSELDIRSNGSYEMFFKIRVYTDDTFIDTNTYFHSFFYYVNNSDCRMCGGSGNCPYCGGSGVTSYNYSTGRLNQCGMCLSHKGKCVCKDGVSGHSSIRDTYKIRESNSSNGSGGYVAPQNTYTPNSNNSSGSTTARTCSVCNGKGRISGPVNYAPNYGGNDTKVYCSECNSTTFKHTHSYKTCSACRGTGVIK